MIVYLDTSALVKLFVRESHSETMIRLCEGSQIIGTSVVAFAECAAAFARKFREKRLSPGDYKKIMENLAKEYSQLVKVSVSDELNEIISVLLEKYPLRGFDAIHLASALIFKRKGNIDLKFACFDRRLNSCAEGEKLDVVFP